MKKQTFTVPVWALSYLANGDKSGLNLEDLALCRDFERRNRIYHGLMAADNEEFFSGKNDVGGLACNCVEATFHVRFTSDELFSKIVCRVDSSRGAPMGRHDRTYPLKDGGFSDYSKPQVDWTKTPYFQRLVPINSGGYDRGGAYWGLGGKLLVRFSKDGNFWEFCRESDSRL